MTAETDESVQLLALADLLEKWAESVPMWQPGTAERWDSFAVRRYEAEQDLETRLRRLPGCKIRMDQSRTTVELRLAGIDVVSNACILAGR